jgi:HK97 family phage portal protein
MPNSLEAAAPDLGPIGDTMNLRQRIATWIGGKAVSEAVSGMFEVRGTGAPRKGTTELIQSYTKSPWLRGVVSKIADHMAAVPWVLFVKKNSKTGKSERCTALEMAGFEPRQRLKAQYQKLAVLAPLEDHPLLSLLSAPNETMAGVSARKVSSVYYDLKGEVFWLLERNGLNTPVEWWPIPPNWVTALPREGNDNFEVHIRGQRLNVPRTEMLWIRDLNPVDPYARGSGFGESLMDEIDTDEYAAKVAKNIFFNKARPDMIVAIDGADGEALENAKAVHEQKFRGYQNAHQIMWTSGKLTFKELQQKFADLEVMELRKFEREAFITTFGVPPEIMGLLESSNRATVTQAVTIFAKEVLVPRLEVWRAELQRQLVPMFDARLLIDYINPIPEDDDFQLEAMKANPHTATQAEWRELQGLPERGDEDNVHWVPFNLMQVKPGDAPPPPAPNTTPPKMLAEPKAEKAGLEDIIAEASTPTPLQTAISPVFLEEIAKWGNQVLTDLGVGISFSMVDSRVVNHLSELSGKKIVGINETTREAIRAAMRDGILDGDSPAKMANRIRAVFDDANKRRAVTIARTEVVNSSNFGTFTGYSQSGVVSKKQWVSTLDDRVRDMHAEMNGKVVALETPFQFPDGILTMYPGESGAAHHDINERCTITAVIDNEFSEAQLAEVWHKYDKQLVPWESKTEAAAKAAFAEQEKAVLKVLRSILGS